MGRTEPDPPPLPRQNPAQSKLPLPAPARSPAAGRPRTDSAGKPDPVALGMPPAIPDLNPALAAQQMNQNARLQFGPLLVMDSTYPSEGGGGAESQVGTLGRWFNANGYPATLVTPLLREARQIESEVIDGLPVLRLRYPRFRLIGALVLHLKLAATLWQYRHRSCAIHAHIGSWMAATCCLLGPLIGLPVFVKMTGTTELAGGALDPDGNWLARLKRAALTRATGYQAISSEIVRAIIAVGLPAEKILPIANAVDLNRFGQRRHDGVAREVGKFEAGGKHPAPPALRDQLCPGAGFVMLFSGRLEQVKRLDLLLDAWRDALAHDKSAWLVLAGAGSEREQLEALARANGIADRVVFTGRVAAIADYIQAADAMALVSDSEGLSNSLLEGMAGGLPVLGSRISGTEDFVREGETGWLFEAGDGAMLARQLSAARATSPEALKRLSQAAHDEVVKRASVQAVTHALLHNYALHSRPEHFVMTPERRESL